MEIARKHREMKPNNIEIISIFRRLNRLRCHILPDFSSYSQRKKPTINESHLWFYFPPPLYSDIQRSTSPSKESKTIRRLFWKSSPAPKRKQLGSRKRSESIGRVVYKQDLYIGRERAMSEIARLDGTRMYILSALHFVM